MAGRSEPIRLIQITDTHFSADPAASLDGIHVRQSLAAVVDHIGRHERDFDAVLATGDLSHDGSEESYVALREALERLGAPVYCIAGNHDVPAVMTHALAAPQVRMIASTRFGAWHAVFLNTHVPDFEGGRLGDDQLRHFEVLLSKEADAPTLVCLHHPPLPIGSLWMDAMGLQDAEAFLAVVDRHTQIRAVVWGHVHQVFEQERNGILYCATPSTCVQFRPGSHRYQRDDLAAGYRRLLLGADGRIASTVVRMERSQL